MEEPSMKNSALYLPGFDLATLWRKPHSTRQKLADELAEIYHEPITQLGECFAH